MPSNCNHRKQSSWEFWKETLSNMLEQMTFLASHNTKSWKDSEVVCINKIWISKFRVPFLQIIFNFVYVKNWKSKYELSKVSYSFHSNMSGFHCQWKKREKFKMCYFIKINYSGPSFCEICYLKQFDSAVHNPFLFNPKVAYQSLMCLPTLVFSCKPDQKP
jgi:hypothetical protein